VPYKMRPCAVARPAECCPAAAAAADIAYVCVVAAYFERRDTCTSVVLCYICVSICTVIYVRILGSVIILAW